MTITGGSTIGGDILEHDSLGKREDGGAGTVRCTTHDSLGVDLLDSGSRSTRLTGVHDIKHRLSSFSVQRKHCAR